MTTCDNSEYIYTIKTVKGFTWPLTRAHDETSCICVSQHVTVHVYRQADDTLSVTALC